MELVRYDSTRIDQMEHDVRLFQETSDLIDRFYMMDKTPTRNYCINSDNLGVVYSDYFANAKFSRG